MVAAMPDGARVGTLVLAGCGKMGTAMLRGWLASSAAARFVVVEPAGPAAELAEAAGVSWHRTPDTLPPELTPEAVVFALKPQILDDALPDYRRWVRRETLFLSIAAGKTMAGIARHLGPAALVRAMPNTPAAIGRGITVACASPQVSAPQRQFCERLLAAIGESAWIADEGLMDAVTAVSGSGPAYVFLLIEALARAGTEVGLPEELALHLARSTVAGAGELARQSPESPARLRADVTSPGGTTEAALAVLMGPEGLERLIGRAVAAATARSRQLAS